MDGIKPHRHMAGMKGSDDGVSGNFGVPSFSSVNGSKGAASGAGGSGSFGVKSFGSADVNGGSTHPDAKMSHAPMAAGARAVSGHISRGAGKMPATAHSDHGPHQYR